MAYDLTNSRARDPLIVMVVFTFIAILTTFMRLKARHLRSLPLGLDDYLMLVALFFLLVSVSIQFACVLAGGVGRHTKDVAPADVVKTLKLILPFEALYGVTLCFLKTSVICFYLRIFGNTKSFRISAYVAIVILIMWAMSIVLETFLLCRPLAFNWDPTIPGGVCGQRNKVYVSAGALNVVTDFMVMLLPVPHILGLQLAIRRKLGLLLMFSLGIFITVISIIRIKSLQVISFTDPTYTLPMGLLWTVLEPCLGIINGNLPMVRTILIAFAPGIFGSTNDNTTSRSRTMGLSTKEGRRTPFHLITTGEEIEMGRNGIMVGQTKSSVWGGSKPKARETENDTDSERAFAKGTGIMVGTTVDIESA